MIEIKITDEMHEIKPKAQPIRPKLSPDRIGPGWQDEAIQRMIRGMDDHERDVVLLELIRIYKEKKGGKK